jgi:RNase P/RNase MRP subunit POP5
MKPSERFKKRYVSFALSVAGSPPGYQEAKKIIHEHFLSVFGELSISQLAFKLVEYDQKSGKGILRCARDRADEAILCMALLSEWEGKECRLEPLSTSGSVKRA